MSSSTGGETIFALSSGQDRAGIAVVRVSGPAAADVLMRMARVVPTPRVATRAWLRDPIDGSPLDDALVIWFPAPRSFTGEPSVELHLHGGRAVVAGVLAALGKLPGLRLAEPGEFTRRAFDNGKIDLTGAEGLADLIAAETEAQRRLALRQLAGDLFRTAEGWRQRVLRAQALLEAAIDFADESDVSEGAVADASAIAAEVSEQLEAVLDDQHKGEILRSGFQVVIAGPPNVGKSSLINAIARRDAAIVSPEAGTTRDVVELQLNLGGLAVIFADTAGVREPEGNVEREGIRRGLARAGQADLALWVIDAVAPQLILPPELASTNVPVLCLVNKSDLVDAPTLAAIGEKIGSCPWMAVSAVRAVGLSALEAEIARVARDRTIGGEQSLITTARHRQHLQSALRALCEFSAGDKSALEFRAEDLRRAALEIGRLVGKVDVEEILGEIFSRFCIGK